VLAKLRAAGVPVIVVLVSGRPLDVAPLVDGWAALVAAWLPGSEGAGVADVLFGDKPFTGRLPQTWAKSEAQIPINVGDASYDPAYPFGWGLRTDSARARLAAVRSQLSGAAASGVDALLAADDWNADGSVKAPGDVLARLIALPLGGLPFTTIDPIVSVARDIAQAAMVRRGINAHDSALTADAEHAVLTGDAATALRKLAAAANVSVDVPGGAGGTVPATLSLALSTAQPFRAFQVGADGDYTTSLTATVVSTAGDAALSVVDPSPVAPGHLVNGTFFLPSALQARANGGTFGSISGTPLALWSWTKPVSNDVVALDLMQHIGKNDALRTGTYAKTLTYTLSTTNP
jgi:beta-glucosidase